MKAVAESMRVASSNLIDRPKGGKKPRWRRQKVQYLTVMTLIMDRVSARPTYGYPWITAILQRQ